MARLSPIDFKRSAIALALLAVHATAGAATIGPQFTVATVPSGGNGIHYGVGGGDGSQFAVSWDTTTSILGASQVQTFNADGSAASSVDTSGKAVLNQTVAVDKAGNFAEAWTDGSPGGDVYLQRYSAAGPAQGEQKWLGAVYNGAITPQRFCGVADGPVPNGTIYYCDYRKSSSPIQVAMDDDGDVAVAWTESEFRDVQGYYFFSPQCTATNRTYAAVYRANGTAISLKHQISSSGVLSGMAMNGAGTIAVLFNAGPCTVGGVDRAEFYSTNLIRKGTAQLSRYMPSGIVYIHSGMYGLDGSGTLTVAWVGYQEGYGNSISLSRFASDGSVISGALGPYGDPDEDGYYLAVSSAGDIALGWNIRTQSASGFNGFQNEKQAQLIAPDGSTETGVLEIDDGTTQGNLPDFALAYSGSGNVVGIWNVINADNSASLVGRSLTP